MKHKRFEAEKVWRKCMNTERTWRDYTTESIQSLRTGVDAAAAQILSEKDVPEWHWVVKRRTTTKRYSTDYMNHKTSLHSKFFVVQSHMKNTANPSGDDSNPKNSRATFWDETERSKNIPRLFHNNLNEILSKLLEKTTFFRPAVKGLTSERLILPP